MADTRSDKAEIDRRKGTRETKQAPKSLPNKGKSKRGREDSKWRNSSWNNEL